MRKKKTNADYYNKTTKHHGSSTTTKEEEEVPTTSCSISEQIKKNNDDYHHQHPKLNPQTNRVVASDFQSILHANSAFYSAFDSLDMIAMKEVWLPNSMECFCKFPGSKNLIGTTKIMKSWQHAINKMNGNLNRNWMEPRQIQIEFQSNTSAILFCEELIYAVSSSIVHGQLLPQSKLIQKYIATNGFKKVQGKWYMWFHEASLPGSNGEIINEDAKSTTTSKSQATNEQNWHPTTEEKLSEMTSLTMDVMTVNTAAVTKKTTMTCGQFVAEKCKCGGRSF